MSTQENENSVLEREEIVFILDQFQQKWGKTNAQIAKELGMSDVSLSYAKNGKRSGKNILVKLRTLADSYDLYTPEPEKDRAEKEHQLHLAQQLKASHIHPALVQSAYAYLGLKPDTPFLSFLGDEGVVQLALYKQAQHQQFLKSMGLPQQKLPQQREPTRALSSPQHTVTIIEESQNEHDSRYDVIRWCRTCGVNIKGVKYEVPAKNPTYGYLYDYYCEQCEQKRMQQYQAQKYGNRPQRNR